MTPECGPAATPVPPDRSRQYRAIRRGSRAAGRCWPRQWSGGRKGRFRIVGDRWPRPRSPAPPGRGGPGSPRRGTPPAPAGRPGQAPPAAPGRRSRRWFQPACRPRPGSVRSGRARCAPDQRSRPGAGRRRSRRCRRREPSPPGDRLRPRRLHPGRRRPDRAGSDRRRWPGSRRAIRSGRRWPGPAVRFSADTAQACAWPRGDRGKRPDAARTGRSRRHKNAPPAGCRPGTDRGFP